MSDPRVITASFSEWRMVKTRKTLQLVFEVPLERQAEVLTMLGAPMPDQEIWCAIALMSSAAKEPDAAKSERAKETYRGKSDMEQAATRAAIMCKDRRYWSWCGAANENEAAQHMYVIIGYPTRSVIATNEDAYRAFLAHEVEFKQMTGQYAEQRG